MAAMRAARFVPAFVVAAVVVLAAPAYAVNVWPNYGGTNRTSNDTSAPSLSPLHSAWNTGLDQKVYAQPLVFDGRVYAATQNDTVYALDAHDGAVLWSRHVGTPMTNVAAQTGCGDVDPLGILSTPVIDTASKTIYVVATIEDSPNHIHHQLIGLNAVTGAPVVSANADPIASGGDPAQNPLNIQQRTGLGLANGRVYIGYGGFAGDCGAYRGWMVSLSEAGTGKVSFDVTHESAGEGAIWAPGGVGIDSHGFVYASTGNPDPSGNDLGESVLKFNNNSTMNLLGAFKTFPGDDHDLSSVAPAVLPNNLLFQIGKQQTGYLVDTSAMQEVTHLSMCTGVADGADAWDGSHLYVPCAEGIQQVNINVNAHPATMSLGWKGPAVGHAGAPTIADGKVWFVDFNSGTLYALDPANGHTLFTEPLGGVPHFTSVTSALGLLLVGTNSGVTAFAGPTGVPPHAPSACLAQTGHTSYWIASLDGNVVPLGDAPACGSLAGTPPAKPVVGIAGTTVRGYWLGASDGGVFSFGPDAQFYGSMGGKALNKPIVGIASAPTANGYYLVASDGGIFNFGPGTHFHGSAGGLPLAKPIVGMAVAPNGNGYYLVASDGGVFTYGPGAHFHGSMGGKPLNKPIVGMALTADGNGYWLVASDGGIFTFGDAAYHGSMGGKPLNEPIVGMATTGGGGGYWLVASDGGVFSFSAPFRGSAAGFIGAPAVGMAHD
jgi:outer membrane protein assembly factor BamB